MENDLIREIQQGTITALYMKQGYGFLRNDKTNKTIFFHATALLNFPIEKMRVGDTVAYREILSRDERINAGHIRRIATLCEIEGEDINE